MDALSGRRNAAKCSVPLLDGNVRDPSGLGKLLIYRNFINENKE